MNIVFSLSGASLRKNSLLQSRCILVKPARKLLLQPSVANDGMGSSDPGNVDSMGEPRCQSQEEIKKQTSKIIASSKVYLAHPRLAGAPEIISRPSTNQTSIVDLDNENNRLAPDSTIKNGVAYEPVAPFLLVNRSQLIIF